MMPFRRWSYSWFFLIPLTPPPAAVCGEVGVLERAGGGHWTSFVIHWVRVAAPVPHTARTTAVIPHAPPATHTTAYHYTPHRATPRATHKHTTATVLPAQRSTFPASVPPLPLLRTTHLPDMVGLTFAPALRAHFLVGSWTRGCDILLPRTPHTHAPVLHFYTHRTYLPAARSLPYCLLPFLHHHMPSHPAHPQYAAVAGSCL